MCRNMKPINKYFAIFFIALINVKMSFGADKNDWVEALRNKTELKHETTVPDSKQTASTSGSQRVEGRQMGSTVSSPQQFENKKHNARSNNGNSRRNGNKVHFSILFLFGSCTNFYFLHRMK